MTDERTFQAILDEAQATFSKLIQEAVEHGRRLERQEMLSLVTTRLTSSASSVMDVFAKGSVVTNVAVRRAAPAQRVAAGTVRPLVQQVLKAEGGLTKAEVTRRVVGLNADIAAPSITNELLRNENVRRNRNHLYRRTKRGLWYLLNDGLPETEGSAVTVGDRPTGVTRLNGGDHDETTTLNPSGLA